MKNTVINRIVITVFLLFCLIPSLGMVVFGQSRAGANEVLSKFPAVVDKSGSLNGNYLSEISDWAGDRFAFRQELVTAWSGLNAALFKTSSEDKVIIGRDGWLYYSETLDDYRGMSLEDRKLEAIARNLSLMQEYVESNGTAFLFTIAPNKNSIYPEHMPNFVPNGRENANSERLMPYIEKYGVNYADLFSAISHENETMYFMTDSHWHNKGAALAADVILSGLGRDSSFFNSEFIHGEEHKGDLYEMLYPSGNRTESDFKYLPGFTFTTAKDPNGGNAINIESSSEKGIGRLLCWRDSFGISLYPYLAETFHDAVFSRSATYDLVRLKAEETDAVVIELVERNLNYLLENMPIYPAPIRNMPEIVARMPAIAVSAQQGKTAASNGMMLIQAEIPADSADNTTNAFFVCGGPCYEAAILYIDGSGPVVSAWIPAADTGDISVVYGNDGGYCISDAA